MTPNLVTVSLATVTFKEKKPCYSHLICYISACGTRREAKEFKLL